MVYDKVTDWRSGAGGADDGTGGAGEDEASGNTGIMSEFDSDSDSGSGCDLHGGLTFGLGADDG
jgi:hypothetical protein